MGEAQTKAEWAWIIRGERDAAPFKEPIIYTP